MKMILLLFAALLFVSCKKSQSNCTPEQLNFEFLTNSRIDTFSITPGFTNGLYQYQIMDGTKTVFRFQKILTVCPGVQDGGGARDVVFEISSSADSFKIADSIQLVQAKTWSQNNCYGCEGAWPIVHGSMEGFKKNENVWHVKATLSARSFNAGFEADFRKSN